MTFAKIAASEGDWDVDLAAINGATALVTYHRGRLDTVFVCSTDGERIIAIRAIRNPDKLQWVAQKLAGQS